MGPVVRRSAWALVVRRSPWALVVRRSAWARWQEIRMGPMAGDPHGPDGMMDAVADLDVANGPCMRAGSFDNNSFDISMACIHGGQL